MSRALSRRHSRVLSPATLCVLGATTGLLLGGLAGERVLARIAPQGVRLERLSVEGQQRVSTQELVSAAELRLGEPLAALRSGALRARLRGLPWVRDARVATLPSGRLLLAVDERQPLALALAATPQHPARPSWHYVDAEGTPFAPASRNAALPRLVASAATTGAPSPLLRQGVALLAALKTHGLPAAREVRLTGADAQALPALLLDLGGKAECRVILGGGDPDPGLARLARLLAEDLPQTRAATSIDLRFGEQLILRSDPPAGGPSRLLGGAVTAGR